MSDADSEAVARELWSGTLEARTEKAPAFADSPNAWAWRHKADRIIAALISRGWSKSPLAEPKQMLDSGEPVDE